MAKGIRNIWIDSDTPESIGNKVIRDGVEIADVLNGVQQYDDPDVVVNREYKYVIQSYTATGQSTNEVLGDNLNYYTIVEAGDLQPIMTDFRVEDANKNRILFDTPLGPVTGLTTQGFTVSGNNISAIDTANNYITVGSAFDFWDNNTIRLESGDGTVYDFTMEHIVNSIDEPTATTIRYVSVNGGGTGDGTSEANAWTMAEAKTNSSAGMTIWVKKGNYNDQIVFTSGGSIDNPVVYKGYDTTPGDLDDDYIVDSFTYTSTSQAETFLDPTKWPVFTGTQDGSEGFYSSGRSYYIIKNIQLRDYQRNIWLTGGATGWHFENITTALGYLETGTAAKGGDGMLFGTDPTNSKIRVKRCLNFDNGGLNTRFYGDHNAMIDSLSYSGISFGTDYYVSLYKSNNTIIKGNKAIRPIYTSHNGHAFGIKAEAETCEYNLFDGNHVENISEGVYSAYENSSKNVFKNNSYKQTLAHQLDWQGGSWLIARGGAHDDIFENNYAEDSSQGIVMWTGNDGTSADVARDCIFRNNIFKDIEDLIVFVYGNVTGTKVLADNKIYNNTFFSSIAGSTFCNNSAAVGEITFTGNEFKNNIVDGVDNLYSGSADDSELLKEYNDWFDCGFATPSGIENIDIDPVYNNTNEGGFEPTATLSTIDAPKLTNYDAYWNERGDFTAMGAVKNANEV